MKIKALHIVSEINPAGGGRLPRRIVLHLVEGTYPLVTHLEVQHPDGKWHTSIGNYFDDLEDAIKDFYGRSETLLRNRAHRHCGDDYSRGEKG